MKVSFGKLWPYVLGAALVGAIAYGFLPAAVEIDAAPATRGPLRVTVDQEGKTRIKEKYVVSSPLAGRLQRIELRPGDAVVAGKTPLATIEPTDPTLLDARSRAEAEARVKAAEANRKRSLAAVERDQQAYQLAQHAFERAKALIKSKGLAPEDFDRIEHGERVALEALRVAQFGTLIAEFELEQARAALLRTQPRQETSAEAWRFEIRSPITGQTLRVFQESALVVAPGTRLLEVGDPADLECEIDVLSTDAVKIVPGAKVLLERWGGDQPLAARVRVIEPAAFMKVSALGVEEQRVWVIADFVDPLERRKALGDGYRVEARIVIWEKEDVLKVPAGALFRHKGSWAVFVADHGRARLRVLRVGQRNDLEAEILEGLQPGEQVILHPSDRITDGLRIALRKELRTQ